jgi:hypothetical protein
MLFLEYILSHTMKRTNILLYLVTLVVCSLAAPVPSTFGQSVTRGPYLQRAHKDFAILKWRTDITITPTVKVGTTPGAETFSFTGSPTTEHRVEISGLRPSTRYYYKVISGNSVLAGGDESHSFVTSPNDGDEPFNVWALGDSGISATLASGEHAQQASVRDGFLNVVPLHDLAFLMHLGDIAYYEGTDIQYQRGFFDIYPTILRALTTWPTQGNHDYTANAYYTIFSLPRSAEAGGTPSSTEAYYSWDYGNAHFVSLNSERTSPRSAMESWLRNDLSTSTKPWNIVIFHHPPYTKGSHDSDNVSDSGGKMQYMRQTILPILEQYGVDVVLSGHSHSYERSHFINGHYGDSSTFTDTHTVSKTSGRDDQAYTKSSLPPQANSGTVYVVAGSGGMLDSSVPLNHPAMFDSQATLGSLLLSFNAHELTVKFITSTATVGDYFTIRKNPARPRKPSSVDVAAGSGCTLKIGWEAATGATSYDIYRSEHRHTRGTPISSGVATTTYTDSAPTPGRTHYYSVRGVNGSGHGAWSDVDSGVVSSSDSDGDGTQDCADECPNDPGYRTAAPCGCGMEPLGTFSDGRSNCSASLTTRRIPSSPRVTSTRGILNITMDSYKEKVVGYSVSFSRNGRTLKRMRVKRPTLTIRKEWRNSIWIRYRIDFTSGTSRVHTRWSKGKRIR